MLRTLYNTIFYRLIVNLCTWERHRCQLMKNTHPFALLDIKNSNWPKLGIVINEGLFKEIDLALVHIYTMRNTVYKHDNYKSKILLYY